jgi:hypothetical protein
MFQFFSSFVQVLLSNIQEFSRFDVDAWSEFAIIQFDDTGILFSEAQSRKVSATSIAFSKFTFCKNEPIF